MASLHSLQTLKGNFTIAAFDHRASLAETLNIPLNTTEGTAAMIELKQLFLDTFADQCSAVLTDPIWGKETLDRKPTQTGLLLSLEESGYEGGKEVVPPLLPDWGVKGIKGYGAAVKMLLYFHPDEKNAEKKIELIKKIKAECEQEELVFLLEPVLFPIESEAEFIAHWSELQLQTVGVFDEFCDVLKIEYPGLYAATEDGQRLACEKVTQTSDVPWILLSRGMKFEPYSQALSIAMKSGAKGFAAGRAVWQEIEQWKPTAMSEWPKAFEQMRQFLQTTGRERMAKLIEIVENKGGL